MSMNLLEKIVTLQRNEPEKNSQKLEDEEKGAFSWVEKTSDSISTCFCFEPCQNSHLSVKVLEDSRPVLKRVTESFLNTFFPSGYPYSVNEGYLRYTQFRALQHFTSATLSVLSTQSLLFAAGLRPTPAQATVVSWILKDGMEHVGKLLCSNLGARMDSEPKRWRILADILYDFGTGLQVMSPLCPHLFLQMAGLGNFAKTSKISSSADLRYKEDLLFPGRLIEASGRVKFGRPLHEVTTPSKIQKWKETFPDENFILSRGTKWTDIVLDQNATGEDALRGWLVAAYVSKNEISNDDVSFNGLYQAYEEMETVFPMFLDQLQKKGWYTDRFLDGTTTRFAF